MALNLINWIELYAITYNRTEDFFITDIDIDARIDRDILYQVLLRDCGMLMPYTQTLRTYYNRHVLWFKQWKDEISRMCDIQEIDYDIKENYFMYEDNKRVLDRTEDLDADGGNNIDVNESGSNSNSITYGKGADTEHTVSAYNEAVYQPQYNDKTQEKGSDSTSGSDTRHRDGDSSWNEQHDNDIDETVTEDNKRHGNNGEFPIQDLLQKEIDFLENNVYQWISNKYRRDNMLGVY